MNKLVYLHIDRHWACFQILATTKTSIMSSPVHIFLHVETLCINNLHLGENSCRISYAHLCSFIFSWHCQRAHTDLHTHQQHIRISPGIMTVKLLKHFPIWYVWNCPFNYNVLITSQFLSSRNYLFITFVHFFNWKVHLFLVHLQLII